jgi:hypothetical protein
LWLKVLELLKEFPPLQAPAIYNLIDDHRDGVEKH